MAKNQLCLRLSEMSPFGGVVRIKPDRLFQFLPRLAEALSAIVTAIARSTRACASSDAGARFRNTARSDSRTVAPSEALIREINSRSFLTATIPSPLLGVTDCD
jgi:hypothetical protein